MNYKNVKIAEGARIAKQSVILGDVTIGRDSCVLSSSVRVFCGSSRRMLSVVSTARMAQLGTWGQQ